MSQQQYIVRLQKLWGQENAESEARAVPGAVTCEGWGGVLENQERMGFSISTLHNIPSVTFMCLVRDGSEESHTMQTLVSFLLQLATVYCFCLTQTCIYIVDGTKWLLYPQCDLQVLFLTHLLLYHYITVYHFHFEIYLARSKMPSYLWYITALKTSIREGGGQMALVTGVIIIIPRSRDFVTSAGALGLEPSGADHCASLAWTN